MHSSLYIQTISIELIQRPLKSIADYNKFKSYDFIQFYEALLLAAEDAGSKAVP
jgi:hypothetical protein